MLHGLKVFSIENKDLIKKYSLPSAIPTNNLKILIFSNLLKVKNCCLQQTSPVGHDNLFDNHVLFIFTKYTSSKTNKGYAGFKKTPFLFATVYTEVSMYHDAR